MGELRTPYFEREPNSPSKLSTYRDGLRILLTTLVLFRDERPLAFFGFMAFVAAATSLVLGIDIVIEFMRTHLVPRLPTAILATGLMLSAFLALTCGLILDSVARGRRETKRLAYLGQAQLDLADNAAADLPAQPRRAAGRSAGAGH
jgi:hypothetical protein